MFVLIVLSQEEQTIFPADERRRVRYPNQCLARSTIELRPPERGKGGRGNARLAAEACEGDGRRRLRGAVAERRPVTKDTNE